MAYIIMTSLQVTGLLTMKEPFGFLGVFGAKADVKCIIWRSFLQNDITLQICHDVKPV